MISAQTADWVGEPARTTIQPAGAGVTRHFDVALETNAGMGARPWHAVTLEDRAGSSDGPPPSGDASAVCCVWLVAVDE